MSLNGTLETFALPDVLALLAATRKTGELQVDGGRGDARLWLANGEMVGADVPRATTFVDALFEMLRLTSGTFAFDNDGTTASPSDPMAIEPLLLEAQSRLGEWKSIEAVVPATTCGVKLAVEVSAPQVSVTPEQWRTLVAVATSRDVEGVINSLRLGEFASCRMLKDLVQMGLVTIADAPEPEAEAKAPTQAPAAEAPSPLPAAASPAEPEPALGSFPAPRRVSGSSVVAAARSSNAPIAPVGREAERPVTPVPADLPAAAATVARSTKPKPAPAAAQDEPAQSPADLVHQLAQLQSDTPSPAPRRPATATPAQPATATPTEGQDGAATPTEDEPTKAEEPLNRGLLLKFLNSVRT